MSLNPSLTSELKRGGKKYNYCLPYDLVNCSISQCSMHGINQLMGLRQSKAWLPSGVPRGTPPHVSYRDTRIIACLIQ